MADFEVGIASAMIQTVMDTNAEFHNFTAPQGIITLILHDWVASSQNQPFHANQNL